MPESKIIAPEKEVAGMDLDLFLKIMPAVRVGDRIVCTVGIEHIEYQDIVTGDYPDSTPETQLAISYQSGCVYLFDDEEEMELEQALKTAIQKSEEAARQQMNLVQENAMLKQEITRLMAGQIQGKIINPGFGKRH